MKVGEVAYYGPIPIISSALIAVPFAVFLLLPFLS